MHLADYVLDPTLENAEAVLSHCRIPPFFETLRSCDPDADADLLDRLELDQFFDLAAVEGAPVVVSGGAPPALLDRGRAVSDSLRGALLQRFLPADSVHDFSPAALDHVPAVDGQELLELLQRKNQMAPRAWHEQVIHLLGTSDPAFSVDLLYPSAARSKDRLWMVKRDLAWFQLLHGILQQPARECTRWMVDGIFQDLRLDVPLNDLTRSATLLALLHSLLVRGQQVLEVWGKFGSSTGSGMCWTCSARCMRGPISWSPTCGSWSAGRRKWTGITTAACSTAGSATSGSISERG